MEKLQGFVWPQYRMFGAIKWEKELDMRWGWIVEPKIAFQRMFFLFLAAERHYGVLRAEG